MAKALYVVEPHDDTWAVSLGGRSFGPYSSLAAAIRAAMDAAHKAEAMGHDVEVEVLDAPSLPKSAAA